ncbi:MAG: DoxX family protein [Candidatus Altimarinota bacterium]
MKKSHKIIYWIATLWLALGMVSTGIVQIMQIPAEVDLMAVLGYPAYFLIILGVWKILGTIAILAPKYPLVKEWAYAGFFFAMTGAIFSHFGAGQGIIDVLPATLLLVLTITSWYFRPASRKLTQINK